MASASRTIESARKWVRYSACASGVSPGMSGRPGVERPVPRWSSRRTRKSRERACHPAGRRAGRPGRLDARAALEEERDRASSPGRPGRATSRVKTVMVGPSGCGVVERDGVLALGEDGARGRGTWSSSADGSGGAGGRGWVRGRRDGSKSSAPRRERDRFGQATWCVPPTTRTRPSGSADGGRIRACAEHRARVRSMSTSRVIDRSTAAFEAEPSRRCPRRRGADHQRRRRPRRWHHPGPAGCSGPADRRSR